MITLTVKARRQILGTIRDGQLIRSELGEAVVKNWLTLNKRFPEIEADRWALMPDHFHGLIRIKKPLPFPLGEVVRAFKIACTQSNAALECPHLFDGKPSFWFPGFYDTILFSKGQLERMKTYIRRNVERRWAVMQNPDLFKVTRSITLPNGQISDALGNPFLLELPDKQLIQISRRASDRDIEHAVREALLHGERGSVAVSGCISPGEQAVAKALREANRPLIVIIPRGFGPYFKPGGHYFTACERGKLLMLSPFPQISKYQPLTRDRCFAINTLAAELCDKDPAALRYHGSQPPALTLPTPGHARRRLCAAWTRSTQGTICG